MSSISLVITTYNRSAFLGSAIESVLGQTRADFELLVWDDGSTDGTAELAREHARRDSRVRFIPAEHQGRPAALSSAIAQTSSPYIGWLDDDDLLEPTALEETAAVLDAKPDVGVVYTDYITINSAGRRLGIGARCKIPYSRDRMLIDFMMFQFRLMRRSTYEQAGGIDGQALGSEDYDLCLRLSEIANVHHLQRPLYLYRVHPDRTSSQKRLEQILTSQEAVRRALKRRGMDEQFDIEVEIVGKFYLRRKLSTPSPAADLPKPLGKD